MDFLREKLNFCFKPLGLMVCCFSLLGCVEVGETPFGTKLKTKIRNNNIHQLTAIADLNLENDFKFAFISDIHQNYSDLESVIHLLNQREDVDFVVIGGDLTNSSYAFEFDLTGKALSRLKKPALTVIGNHDALGGGKDIFREMFGPMNFTMEFASTRFIFFNNNSLEFYSEGIDLGWLQQELNNSLGFNQVILVHHVNPFNLDYFTDSENIWFANAYSNSSIDLILNGHRQVFNNDRFGSILIHQTRRIEEGSYSLITFSSQSITIEHCRGNRCQLVSLP